MYIFIPPLYNLTFSLFLSLLLQFKMNRQAWQRILDWSIFSTNNAQGIITPETSNSSSGNSIKSDTLTVTHKQRNEKIKSVEKRRPNKTKRTKEQHPSTQVSGLQWEQHPEAWAHLIDSHNIETYLVNRHFSNERKGYLIGSDSLCDLM